MTPRLLLGDCLERMSEIEDGSIDLVLSDPPYQLTACAWDSMIPLEPMWAHLKRVTKPNAAIVMTASQPFTTTLIASNMKMFKYCWVWKKILATGFSHSKNMPLKDYEDIVVFSKAPIGHAALLGSQRMNYNPQGIFGCERKNKRASKGFNGAMERKSQTNEYISVVSGFPKMVIEFSNVIFKKTTHPTQKPVALMAYLIRTYTNAGDTVLDFCCGSGTTGVACEYWDRRFIGIERDPEYFAIAENRIKDAAHRLC